MCPQRRTWHIEWKWQLNRLSWSYKPFLPNVCELLLTDDNTATETKGAIGLILRLSLWFCPFTAGIGIIDSLGAIWTTSTASARERGQDRLMRQYPVPAVYRPLTPAQRYGCYDSCEDVEFADCVWSRVHLTLCSRVKFNRNKQNWT